MNQNRIQAIRVASRTMGRQERDLVQECLNEITRLRPIEQKYKALEEADERIASALSEFFISQGILP